MDRNAESDLNHKILIENFLFDNQHATAATKYFLFTIVPNKK